jgi:hypothetical protein
MVPDTNAPDADCANSPDTDISHTCVTTAETAAMIGEADAVDEEGGCAIRAGQLAFQHVNVEGQLVALELSRFQRDDGIADFSIRPR